MAKSKAPSLAKWFANCGGFRPEHDLDILRRGIDAGLLNAQDEHGMTALGLAVTSGWKAGVDALLQAGADTELRHFRTGETALHLAMQRPNETIIAALVASGANPDAPNSHGLTPRAVAARREATWFDTLPPRETALPPTRFQNAEHSRITTTLDSRSLIGRSERRCRSDRQWTCTCTARKRARRRIGSRSA